MLRGVEEYLPAIKRISSGMGQSAYKNTPFFRAFLAMSFFMIPSLEALRNRFLADFGLSKMENIIRLSLLEILEDRWGKAVAIIVS